MGAGTRPPIPIKNFGKASMCVIVPCRTQFSAKLFVCVSYEEAPPRSAAGPATPGFVPILFHKNGTKISSIKYEHIC